MPQLLSPDTFEFFARYLLAGYVVIAVRARFIAGIRPKPAEVLIEAVILSLINQFLFGVWLLCPWISNALTQAPQFRTMLEVVVQPVFLGCVFGLNLSAGWKNAFLRRISIPVVHPTERAHDFAFAGREPCFVIVTYEDGTSVRGYFGPNSIAASDEGRSDLYLERLYGDPEDGTDTWVELAPSRGAWMSLAAVRSIEFLEVENAQNYQ